ncbi:hypothetical protein K440DRAFT_254215 [Wilcoxina mikolae CBS 423.85]|nr:hypothetical protein K440DRAFT_254215 [Wilcoxina mikolae CBS 423.85]
MAPISLHYRHILFDSDGKSITPLIAADDLPTHLFTVLPPKDRNLVMLREIPPAALTIETNTGISTPTSITPVTRTEPLRPRWRHGSVIDGDADRRPPSSMGSVKGNTSPSVQRRDLNMSDTAENGAGDQNKGSNAIGRELCAYYHHREGCRRGPQCRFVHSDPEERRGRSMLTEKWRRTILSKSEDGSDDTKVIDIYIFLSNLLYGDSIADNAEQSSSKSSSTSTTCATPGRIVNPTDLAQTVKTRKPSCPLTFAG